jgi:uncharacterized damage-inducible protein DinB
MSNKEANVLSDTFQKTRDLTRWYLSLLKEVDPYKHWEVNGTRLNSVIWLASHITWAENFLILTGTGGQPVELDWLDSYNIKSSGDLHHNDHNMKIVMAAMKEVHEKAMAHVITLSDEEMEAENVLGFGFGGIKTNRMMVIHAIRHEAMHTGHLSWLCKINKVESV